ncbi:MAG TPA: biotin--[acetyl-CoA-carboxylase] ligase [Gemmatimonadales bacterium]|jgi:BirA family biotin operon repressor/biotin-[acetyl-CoA-carboxylase] ligase
MPADLTWFDALPSTMEAAHARAVDGAVHGTTIVARQQIAGRGTRGRAWSSPRGGLWMSVVARPSRTDALEALSLRVGLAVAAALELAAPALPRLAIKWPNDVVIDGRKLAGILCEARWGGSRCQWVVIGLGLNVRNEIPAELARVAVALQTWDPSAEPELLAAPVAAAVALASREAGPLTDAELRAFTLRDALSGAQVLEPFPGTAEGITPGGALRIRTEAGVVRDVLAGVVAGPS